MNDKYTMNYEHKDELDKFFREIDRNLTEDNNKRDVVYSKKYIDSWDGDKLAGENETLLSNVSEKVNVYMLFTAIKGSSDYKLRYIGKTTRKLARQRLRNHLFKKHDGTGAKLEKVKSHVKSGGSVKISWVLINPESLRNWAEEELISSHTEADWNRENA